MKFSTFLFIAVMFSLASFRPKANAQKIKEYFSVPGPISYSTSMYNLSWSSHPVNNYYKQEYLPAGQQSETFKNMLMIEVVTGDINLQDVVKAKISELGQRKKADALVNYQVVENKASGEYLIDFIISNAIGSKAAIVEWNAYRYMSLKDQAGNKGICLFAYSRRGYGAATNSFLVSLKAEKARYINAVAAYRVPSINIKNQTNAIAFVW